jgi:hypothetical protein
MVSDAIPLALPGVKSLVSGGVTDEAVTACPGFLGVSVEIVETRAFYPCEAEQAALSLVI